jgi:hypothetical protein
MNTIAVLALLMIASLTATALTVGRRLASLDIGWRPPPTVVWGLAGTAAVVLVGSAGLALVMIPRLRSQLGRRG